MNNKKILTICGVIFVAVVIVVCLLVSNSSKQNLEDAKNDLQESYEKYGWVEKETVDVLVSKFNTQVMDNSSDSLNPASTDYLTTGEDSYWYGLITGIYLVVVPEEFKNDKTTEIVDNMTIYVEKSSEYANDSLKYVKHLIKANNSEITDIEIDTLIKEANEKSSLKESAYNGKGITVSYSEDDETYQYQVNRMYK